MPALVHLFGPVQNDDTGFLLENANDGSLSFLALFLPGLARYTGRHNITLYFRNGWPASIQAWHTIDEVFYLVVQENVYVSHSGTWLSNVNFLPWEELPYRCMDDFLEQMLPKCASQSIIRRCQDNLCGLHNEQERRCVKLELPDPELSERGAAVSNAQTAASSDPSRIMEGRIDDSGSEVLGGQG